MLLGNFTTSSTGAFVNDFTIPTAVTAGSHLLEFTAHSGSGDTTIFVDSVSITNTAVPEPSTVVLLGLGAVGLLAVARRRRCI